MRTLLSFVFVALCLISGAQEPCPVGLTAQTATCIGDDDGSITVVGEGGPYTYDWAHDATLTTATAPGLSAGSYSVIVSDALGCISFLDYVLEEPVIAPLGTMDVTDISCPGSADGSITFTVNPGPYTWEWAGAPNVTTTTRSNLAPDWYTAVVTGGVCPSLVSVFLGDPYIEVGGETDYCPSNPPHLTAFPQFSFQPDLYIWSTGETTASIHIQPGTEGLIEVTGIDTVLGCAIQGDITLTQLPSPTVAFAAPDSLCLRVNGIAITTASTADSLVWRWGTNGNSNVADPTIFFTASNWQPITLQGFDLFGCGSVPVRDSVFVRPRLPADFTAEQVPCTPFVDLRFNSPSDSCAFFVGDSLILDVCNGHVLWDMRRYQEYDYIFYSTQPNRCDDTSAVRIDVRTEPTLFLPTAFTPDGDGINDTWPGPVDIPDAGFEIQLYDRWGTNLWATNDTQAKWDGSALPIGVYIYTMRMRDPCEPTKEVARQGHVTIVR